MSKIKKIFAVLLAISLIFAFAACTKSNTDTQSDSTAKKELKNVTLCLDWTPNTNHTGCLLYTSDAADELMRV